MGEGQVSSPAAPLPLSHAPMGPTQAPVLWSNQYQDFKKKKNLIKWFLVLAKRDLKMSRWVLGNYGHFNYFLTFHRLNKN